MNSHETEAMPRVLAGWYKCAPLVVLFCLGRCWLGGTIIFVKLKLLQVFAVVEHTLLVVSGNQIEPSDLANRSWMRGKSSLIGPGSSVATIRMGKTRGRVLRARV